MSENETAQLKKEIHELELKSNQITQDKLNLRYSELCKSYHAIRDFRAKLLGWLPLVSGGGIIILLEHTPPSVHLIGIGVVGFFVTVGLLTYELYNMKKCHKLICLGAELEKELGGDGQFTVHAVIKDKDGSCDGDRTYRGYHFYAAMLIYLSVIGGWVYVFVVGLWTLWA